MNLTEIGPSLWLYLFLGPLGPLAVALSVSL